MHKWASYSIQYISFYKGLGGVTGAILLGEDDFLKEANIWKRRYGGDLYHLYPYILTAQQAFEKRKPLMSQFYEDAKEYAELLKKYIYIYLEVMMMYFVQQLKLWKITK